MPSHSSSRPMAYSWSHERDHEINYADGSGKGSPGVIATNPHFFTGIVNQDQFPHQSKVIEFAPIFRVLVPPKTPSAVTLWKPIICTAACE